MLFGMGVFLYVDVVYYITCIFLELHPELSCHIINLQFLGHKSKKGGMSDTNT